MLQSAKGAAVERQIVWFATHGSPQGKGMDDSEKVERGKGTYNLRAERAWFGTTTTTIWWEINNLQETGLKGFFPRGGTSSKKWVKKRPMDRLAESLLSTLQITYYEQTGLLLNRERDSCRTELEEMHL